MLEKVSKFCARRRHKTTVTLVSAVLTALFNCSALADDISVFQAPDSRPKILLVLDYSDSMKTRVAGTTKSRIEVLREAVADVLANNQTTADFGIGPLFSKSSGGIQWPIGDLQADAATVDQRIAPGERTSMEVVTDMLNKTDIRFGTATVPSLVEAANYFQGGPVELGGVDQRNASRFKPSPWNAAQLEFTNLDTLSANPASYVPSDAFLEGVAPGSLGYCRRYVNNNGPESCARLRTFNCEQVYDIYDYELCQYSHSNRWSGASYKTPIASECQQNVVILVSDGKPANPGNIEGIERMLGMPYENCEDLSISIFGGELNAAKGNCGPEIASYMANNNLAPGISNSHVTTHTIGFATTGAGSDYLRRVAESGGGQYFNATNGEQLTSALENLVVASLPESGQFSNFAVDVNRATFSNDNRVYIPLFKPAQGPVWTGNLKGYFIDNTGLLDVDGQSAVYSGAAGTYFEDEARSFWSDDSDGNDVNAGGASSKIQPESRNLYTFVGDPAQTGTGGVALASSDQYRLSESNASLTDAMFESSVDDKNSLIQWIREQPMGAPLHANAVIANYPDNKRVVFTTTNQGFLHAIDATYPKTTRDYRGGEELFAFMPRSLLRNINYLKNGGYPDEHVYGLDGQITPWHTDHNNDGIVNENDSLLLVFGMGRGGRNYYALDVTNPQHPRFVWQITGGSAPFTKLAQTWSRPSLVSVKSGDSVERVLLFGGGYDDAVDDLHAATPSLGNAIYMVDRLGRLVWSASHQNMDYAIPSDLTVVDTDADGLADRLYTGDLGGNIWRVDFDDVTTSGSFDVSLFAELGGDTYQPFFNAPSVSRATRSSEITVAIGSGNRDNPMKDNTRGALYVILEPLTDAQQGELATSAVTRADLYDVTNEASVPAGELQNHNGWYVQLEAGEKSLSRMVVVEGTLLATTFTPADTSGSNDECGLPSTISRLYTLRLADAGSPRNAVPSAIPNDNTAGTRYKTIPAGGIPPEPGLVFSPDAENIQVFVGNSKELEMTPSLRTQFWYTQ